MLILHRPTRTIIETIRGEISEERKELLARMA